MIFPEIILASSSPRRSFLLENLGYTVEVIPSLFEEIIPEGMNAHYLPVFFAEAKAKEVKKRVKTKTIIVAADTIVLHDGEIKGKPETLDEARQSLHSMANKEHEVITGVSIINNERIDSFSVSSRVFFTSMSDSEIDYYFSQAEVLDKAGSYGIQDWIGMAKISRIEGSYTNIMGLPTAEVYAHLLSLTPKS